jgi:hypothetical protein
MFMVKPCQDLKREPELLKATPKQGKNGIAMVITHEQGVLTSFLRLGSLEQILVQFFMNFGAIDN